MRHSGCDQGGRGQGGVIVPGPFIVKTISRIHTGQAAAYRPLAEEICQLAQEREPRLLAFHIYVTDDASSEVVI